MIRNLIFAFAFIFMAEVFAEELISIKNDRYGVKVDTKGFRFHFTDAEGKVLAPPHDFNGILIDDKPVVNVKQANSNNEFTVTAASGVVFDISITLVDGLVTFTVSPANQKRYNVSLRLGGMPIAHGLGDAGGFYKTFNLVGQKEVHYNIQNDGGGNRWASSFAVFPYNSIAGVVLGSGTQTVMLAPNLYCMKVATTGPIVFNYFLGDMQSIYKRYLDVRLQSGYPNVKPQFRLFELGWESWAALGWNSNAQSVQASIEKLQNEGFPVRWAVTGSGFWEEGGTTTSFGKFGNKYPDPTQFKKWLNDRNVKWMIGMRTEFVPSGGPYFPTTSNRDRDLKTHAYNGNPLSDILIDKRYHLEDANGKPAMHTSGIFPQVPCYMLDGRKPEASRWFADQYKKWGVDGIKEDTMMVTNKDIFNGPMSTIQKDGGLVMARNGSFSSPGTLLRINDTQGAGEMHQRIPINYLQYAACGAPNVYSDTIGYKDNQENVGNIRVGWLMSCTAGLAIGPFNWQKPEMIKAFKRMIMFHYEIAPTLYDAAMKSYQTGYPFTMTPLSIAYPADIEAAKTPSFQWMIGESLMAAPLVKNIERNMHDIYIPEGAWFDYDTGKKYTGPTTLKDYALPTDKTPCFVGGKGVIFLRKSDDAPLIAKIYPIAKEESVFTFYYPDEESKSLITIKKWKEEPVVKDITDNLTIPVLLCKESGAVSFEIRPAHHYQLGN